MLVSVLIPSRARPERLQKTLNSVMETVENPSIVEVLIRLDNDDHHRYGGLTWAGPEVGILRGERMKGYASLNLMYTELAEVATGKYVMIMNDDCWFLTKGWDSALAAIPDGNFIIQFDTLEYGKYEGGPFPVVKNQEWKRFGFPAIGEPADTWLDDTLRKANGYQTVWLDGHYLKHDRDNDEQLAAHRKL